MVAQSLAGRRLLIVEDEYLISDFGQGSTKRTLERYQQHGTMSNSAKLI